MPSPSAVLLLPLELMIAFCSYPRGLNLRRPRGPSLGLGTGHIVLQPLWPGAQVLICQVKGVPHLQFPAISDYSSAHLSEPHLPQITSTDIHFSLLSQRHSHPAAGMLLGLISMRAQTHATVLTRSTRMDSVAWTPARKKAFQWVRKCVKETFKLQSTIQMPEVAIHSTTASILELKM